VRPESFALGEHPWLFSVEFSARQHLLYRLAPPVDAAASSAPIAIHRNACAPA
jgi:hypothetical protein